jgi:SAM-dependent methyltransferase
MTREDSIVELAAWLQTAPGRYLLAWEQDRLDHEVADAFGFHALQLGLPQLDGLRANRMPHRWVATDSQHVPEAVPFAFPPPADAGISTQPIDQPLSLHCEFDALPFPNASIDLVVLPHALELARDPHQALREVERVLVPEGRIIVTVFNPLSLWGLRRCAGRLMLGAGLARSPFLPRAGDFIGYRRLRDWLRLLGFEVEAGRFGCWRPPLDNDVWLQRWAWMDRLGESAWPVLGAVYFVVAVKRVRGMRLVGLVKNEKRKAVAAPAVVASRQRETLEADPG